MCSWRSGDMCSVLFIVSWLSVCVCVFPPASKVEVSKHGMMKFREERSLLGLGLSTGSFNDRYFILTNTSLRLYKEVRVRVCVTLNICALSCDFLPDGNFKPELMLRGHDVDPAYHLWSSECKWPVWPPDMMPCTPDLQQSIIWCQNTYKHLILWS